ASLAWLRLECVDQGETVQLLGQGRPRNALAARNRRQLPEAVVLHRRRPWPRLRVLLRAEVRRLTVRRSQIVIVGRRDVSAAGRRGWRRPSDSRRFDEWQVQRGG